MLTWFLCDGRTITSCLQLLIPQGLPINPSWTSEQRFAFRALKKWKTASPDQWRGTSERATAQECIIYLMWSSRAEFFSKGGLGDLCRLPAKLCKGKPRGREEGRVLVAASVRGQEKEEHRHACAPRFWWEGSRVFLRCSKGSNLQNANSRLRVWNSLQSVFSLLIQFWSKQPLAYAHMASPRSLKSEPSEVGLVSPKLSSPRKVSSRKLFPGKLPDGNFTHGEHNTIQFLSTDVSCILKVL